ncbi:MAG: hypothetical protein CM1200mP15_12180 [Dehalococcoidia bacterium]|nr:MAG: hypothetical protein CM1200mP15_12180 [Dehalococcoidia bacterium]
MYSKYGWKNSYFLFPVLGVEAQGKEINTIEGVAFTGRLSSCSASIFGKRCATMRNMTPGFIVASKALLENEPDADEARIRHWLAGNLCRCTGYDKIVRAVLERARR